MKCYLCRKKAEVELHKGRALCKDCFSHMIEKRVRRDIRMNKMFSKGDRILITDDLDRHLVKKILDNLPAEIFFIKKEDKELIRKNKINKVVVKWTLDDEINRFMKSIFEGRKKDKKADKKQVKILKTITDKEAELFAKFNHLNFEPNPKDEDVEKFLDRIEKEHPNIKYNLFKNIILLNRLT